MTTKTLPASAIIPTRDRAATLAATLASLSRQDVLPAELVVVDGSVDTATRELVNRVGAAWAPNCATVWRSAAELGAATQRNQGVGIATQPFIWFLDDDILFEPGCVLRLWSAMQSDATLGGVNAMITNQRYQPPGTVSRVVFTLLDGRRRRSFAGRVIGPAVNLLPEDDDDLPEIVTVDWLNTTCTMYRREALPQPPFDSLFTGYSMMEDLTLSLRVGRAWKLANARTARIFHDSQPGDHKRDVSSLAAMELVNRHYVMTRVLERTRLGDYFRLFVWEAFQLAVSALRRESRSTVIAMWRGKVRAISQIGRLARSG